MDMSDLQEPSTASTSGSGNEDDDVQWGPETNYLFKENPLPKLSNKKSNIQILRQLLRQKLVHRIKLQTGQELSKRTQGYPNPFVSDPGPPSFYEWRFTPKYRGFPRRALAIWTQQQIRDCNNALENGDFYLVDVRNSGPKPLTNFSIADSSQALGRRAGDIEEPSRCNHRAKLINVAAAAFTKYIKQQTGISEFSYKDILLGNVENQAAGLLGWRWIFPVHGVLTKFPASNNFWSWTTDELLFALHGLLTKTLRLEREISILGANMESRQPKKTHRLNQELLTPTQYRDIELPVPEPTPEIQYPLPQYPAAQQVGNDFNRPIHIDSPAPGMVVSQLVAGLNGAAQIQDFENSNIGLDGFVVQLSSLSQKWQDNQKLLQECIQREQILIVENSNQAAQIKELKSILEGTLTRIKDTGIAFNNKNVSIASASSLQDIYPVIDVQAKINSMEEFYSAERSDLRAQIEELIEVIKDQEAQVQDADSLRERNRVLKAQLAKKTAEASGYEALAALVGGGGTSTPATKRQTLANGANSLPYASAAPSRPTRRPCKTSHQQQSTAKKQPRPQTDMNYSRILRCDGCKVSQQLCENPGHPCIRCQKIGQLCTFNTTDMDKLPNATSAGLSISDPVSTARRVVEETAQFLKNKGVVVNSYRNTSQGQYGLAGQYPPKSVYPPETQYDTPDQFPHQNQYPPQAHMASHSDIPPLTMHETPQGSKRKTMNGFSWESSKKAKMGDYQSPYTIDDQYRDSQAKS